MRFLLLLVALAVLVYLLRRRSSVRELHGRGPEPLRVADAGRAIDALRTSGEEGSFVVFIFRSPDGDPEEGDRVNLQVSIEEGRAGVDWVLLTSTNVRDSERFSRFATGRGHTLLQREMNGVPYLRVEDGDPAQLAQQVMQEIYRLHPEASVEVIIEGFTLPPSR